MIRAVDSCKQIIAQAAQKLVNFPPGTAAGGGLAVDERHRNGEQPERVAVGGGSSLVLFNPLPHPREQVHCVYVNSHKMRVTRRREDTGGVAEEVPQQMAPVVESGGGRLQAIHGRHELCFLATIPAWGFTRYDLVESGPGDASTLVKLRVSQPSALTFPSGSADPYEVEVVGTGERTLELSNELVSAQFDAATGLLKVVGKKGASVGEAGKLGVDVSFVRYGARPHNTCELGG